MTRMQNARKKYRENKVCERYTPIVKYCGIYKHILPQDVQNECFRNILDSFSVSYDFYFHVQIRRLDVNINKCDIKKHQLMIYD